MHYKDLLATINPQGKATFLNLSMGASGVISSKAENKFHAARRWSLQERFRVSKDEDNKRLDEVYVHILHPRAGY